jgi:hypothetical protein
VNRIPADWLGEPEAFEERHGLTVVDLVTVIDEIGPEFADRVERLARVDADAAVLVAIREAVARGLLVEQGDATREPAMMPAERQTA